MPKKNKVSCIMIACKNAPAIRVADLEFRVSREHLDKRIIRL